MSVYLASEKIIAIMENIRRSAGYAESQIRSLLNDLMNSSHTLRLKAIKHFQHYIETYTPGNPSDEPYSSAGLAHLPES